MKNMFTKLLLTILLTKIYTNQCLPIQEVEDLLKEELGGKTIEEASKAGEKYEQIEKDIMIGSLSKNLFWRASPENEKTLQNFLLMKKFTESLKEEEKQFFTTFVACFENPESDGYVLLFRNLDDMRRNLDDMKRNINFRKKKLLFFSELFFALDLIQKQNMTILVTTEGVNSIVKDDKKRPVINLIDNLFPNEVEITKDMDIFMKAPEENEDNKIYTQSNTFTLMCFSIKEIFDGDLGEFEDKFFELVGEKAKSLFEKNFIKENHDKFIRGFSKILKNDVPVIINKPNIFTRFGRWVSSFFKDMRVQMSYDWGDLFEAVITFKKEDRPNLVFIANQLVYFANNTEEKVIKASENSEQVIKVYDAQGNMITPVQVNDDLDDIKNIKKMTAITMLESKAD